VNAYHQVDTQGEKVRYQAPDDLTVIELPTKELLERLIRESPLSYWQQGGNGEASLEAGPGRPSLWIKQPEPGRFFFTYAAPPHDLLVPFDGGSCEPLIRDERGGDPFWIPRACTVGTDEAVEIVSCFIEREEPSPRLAWCYWHELPLADSYPKP
jgi:hypothetical protein